MSLLWIALGIILGVDIRFHKDAGREWFGAVCQTSSSNKFTRLSFSSTMQRQLAGEPASSSTLSLSPPY
jgi:hypothetical protein